MTTPQPPPDPLDAIDQPRARLCEQCGKPLNKRQARFCSRNCYGAWQSDARDVAVIYYDAYPEDHTWRANITCGDYEDDLDTPPDAEAGHE
jgi:hypothetical protein